MKRLKKKNRQKWKESSKSQKRLEKKTMRAILIKNILEVKPLFEKKSLVCMRKIHTYTIASFARCSTVQ